MASLARLLPGVAVITGAGGTGTSPDSNSNTPGAAITRDGLKELVRLQSFIGEDTNENDVRVFKLICELLLHLV
jgi:hypothetical protein